MKASKADLAAVLDRFDPAIRLVLLHGPDEAASRELAARFAKRLAPEGDPLGRVDLDPKTLSQDPGRLADEAAAVSMFGGTKLIRVDGLGDESTEAVDLLLAAPTAGNPVLAVAGDLKPTSKLRKSAEGAPAALAYASYAPEARDAEAIVAELAADYGLKPSRAAARLLHDACGGDRGILRRELEKLALYLDADPARVVPLDPQHLAEIGADVGDVDFGALVNAVAGGDPAETDRQLARLTSQGIPGITSLRAVAKRLWLLLDLRLAVDGGTSPPSAVEAARPPIFWKEKATVAAQLQRWRTAALRAALDRLLTAERDIKRSGTAGDVLAAQALLAIAATAAR